VKQRILNMDSGRWRRKGVEQIKQSLVGLGRIWAFILSGSTTVGGFLSRLAIGRLRI
jgi:hypothetical protein